MFDLDSYLQDLAASCRSAFGDRLLYMGLQGSYLRGEANENSDVDVMVVLDGFSVQDMDLYRGVLKQVGFYEKSCGFICGKEELLRWNPLEVCQLRYTTKDLFGVLTDYLPPAAREDEINYVKLIMGNLYHELCHHYIHEDREKNIAAFRSTCKSVFYLIQNLHYLERGRFVLSRKLLKEAVSDEDRRVLELAELPKGFDFDAAFSLLFGWCQDTFSRTERLSGIKKNEYTVRRLSAEDTPAAHALAWKVFTEYESPDYSPEGTEEFRKSLHDDEYLAGIRYYGAFDEEKLVGILGIRENQHHICFFFVDGDYHRRGIGTKLFLRMLEDYKGLTISLNSSPFGLPFYRVLGFRAVDSEQTVNGIRFTPMEYNGRN